MVSVVAIIKLKRFVTRHPPLYLLFGVDLAYP